MKKIVAESQKSEAPWPTFSREPTGREGGRLDQGLEAERQKAVAVSTQAGGH